jgi:hypothetical protein
MPVIGTCGELLLNGDGRRVVSILSDAVSAPMNTDRTLHEVKKLSNSIAVVGSELGARVIRLPDKVESRHGGEARLAIDVIHDNLPDRRFVERSIQA